MLNVFFQLLEIYFLTINLYAVLIPCKYHGFILKILGHSSALMGSMEEYNTSSTDFTFLGLFNRKETSGLLFAIISMLQFNLSLSMATLIKEAPILHLHKKEPSVKKHPLTLSVYP